MILWAKQFILCTGGAGQLFRESTNPSVATADGHAVAYRAGAELRDMEFMQFHPTVLYIAGSSRSLITEAMRGEGAHLVDIHGHRFMPDYDPRAELAPRDVVSPVDRLSDGKNTRPQRIPRSESFGRRPCTESFSRDCQTCHEFGIDIATDRIPVRPGAHYMIGGVTVDRQGQTTLPGLWAAGEVTSSGLHGANRLLPTAFWKDLSTVHMLDEPHPMPLCKLVQSSIKCCHLSTRRFPLRIIRPGRYTQFAEESHVALRRRAANGRRSRPGCQLDR